MALTEPIAPYVIQTTRGRSFAASPLLAVREAAPPGSGKPRLLDRVRATLRTRQYSRRTEKAYVAWVRRFILCHSKRHPLDMGCPEVAKFLTSPAVAGVSRI
jgi:hypothetical protein